MKITVKGVKWNEIHRSLTFEIGNTEYYFDESWGRIYPNPETERKMTPQVEEAILAIYEDLKEGKQLDLFLIEGE